jgi:hypothetical protein
VVQLEVSEGRLVSSRRWPDCWPDCGLAGWQTGQQAAAGPPPCGCWELGPPSITQPHFLCTHTQPKQQQPARPPTSGTCTSFMKRTPRFSSTMPSEAAKKARIWEMKWRSSSVSFSQSLASLPRSTSSAAGGRQGGGWDGGRAPGEKQG